MGLDYLMMSETVYIVKLGKTGKAKSSKSEIVLGFLACARSNFRRPSERMSIASAGLHLQNAGWSVSRS